FVAAHGMESHNIWRGTSGKDPAPLGGDVNTPLSSERAPVVSHDDRTLYFTRATASLILVATRATTADLFSEVRNLNLDLPGSYDEFPVWLSANGCDLYYRKGRMDTDMDLWRARRCDCTP